MDAGLFMLIWTIILPVLGILSPALFIAMWFGLLPKVARRLTWARFGKSNIISVSSQAGWTELIVTRKGLPEAIIETPEGFRPLPRPRFKDHNIKQTDDEIFAQNTILKKSILKGLGKPIWFAEAGLAPLVNPHTIAAIQQQGKNPENPHVYFEQIYAVIKDLPKHFQKPLKKAVTDLKSSIKARKLTYFDPTKIKEIFPLMYTTSQLKALATECELRGMKKAGKQYTGIIFGGMIILGLIIIAILLISTL